MKRLRLIPILLAFLVVLSSSSLVFPDDQLIATVDFSFRAAGTVFPAGKYLVTFQTQGDLTIQNTATGKTVICPYVTRLASRDDNKGMLVFDKAGDQYYLSEIYEVGIDGFALKGAEGKHTHTKVRAS